MRSLLTVFSLTLLVNLQGHAQESWQPSFWIKMCDTTAYSPRDSSPNACVVHGNAVWIFGGWRSDNDSTWYSASDVWKSEDGIVWDSVNGDPPYSPYCAFVSFRGFIWAFGNTSFRSSDGILWDTVQTNILIGYGSRVAVFQDELWLTNGTSIHRSGDGYNWETTVENAPWEYRAWPGFLAFDNKLWFFGGGNIHSTGDYEYFNDVWSSDDGRNWILETRSAAWPGRYWFGYRVWDDKMWIVGGWDYETGSQADNNRNDTWYTENGIDWFPLPMENSFPERHAPFVWVFNGKLWISSGYGGYGGRRLYNDVWTLTNLWKDNRIEQTFSIPDTITYGMPLPIYPILSSGLEVQVEIQDSELASVITEAPGEVVPGSYTIRYTQPGNSIFEPLEESITIVVEKKDLIVSIPDHHKLFGSPNPGFILEFHGLVHAEDETTIEELPTARTNADRYSPEGVYDVSLEGGISSRYSFIYSPGKLYVKSAELDVVFFPNPVDAFLTIHISKQPPARIQLINATGQIMQDLFAEASSIKLDLSGVIPGIYFLRVTCADQTESIRIVKLQS